MSKNALEGTPPTDEEAFYLKTAYEEPVKSLGRLEETARFLMTVAASTSGLFLAAFKLSLGSKTVSGPAWFLPFICWAIGILLLILVLFPQKYKTGRNEPASWKEAFLRARKQKFRFLLAGTLFFIAGIVSAAYPLAR